MNLDGVELKVVRFEKEIFSKDLYTLPDSVSLLSKNYPQFSALYASRIIEIGDTSQPQFGQNLTAFITDQAIHSMHKRVGEVFDDFDQQTTQLSIALKRYRDNFPEKELPVVYTYVSGLNQSIVTADRILGISLDKYLGVHEPIYDMVYPVIPAYLRVAMQPDYLVSDAIRSWVSTDINYAPEQDNFISRILHEARSVYITKQLLPATADTILWGFSGEQLSFCVNNESEMWKYLIEQKLIFSNDNFRISQFVNPGPFTKDFTTDSPARAAVWIGYQMINKYMARNKEITLSELATESDFQKVLNESRYNP